MSERLEEGLYLCYQPIKTRGELTPWIEFGVENQKHEYEKVKIQESKKQQLEQSYTVIKQNFLQTFLTTIPGRNFSQGSIKEFSELAIVYASTSNAPLATSHDMINQVEMVMSSHTSPSVPFITHIGINRPPLWILSAKPVHKNLAMALHSFGAKVARQYYPGKDYMFTTPLPIMRSILVSSLPSQCVWIVDAAYDKKKMLLALYLKRETISFLKT
ncbi:MAG: hypothetical protein K2P93_02590 [Alphaproteobacteria bacterium]|nr:hypothetical protein [Alphaproteobacteria bacterium]